MRITTIFLLSILLLCFAKLASSVETFEAYRLHQSKVGLQNFGSQTVGFSLLSVLPSSSKLSRRVVVLRFSELDVELFDKLTQKLVGALLILLPSEDQPATPEQLENWSQVEQHMVTHSVEFPVYFAYEDENVQRIYSNIVSSVNSVSNSDNYHLVAAGPTEASPKPLDSVNVIQAWLSGTKTSVKKMKTIVVAAHFDTLAAAPSLANGVDGNGSGVVALLELARLFSKLYSSSKTRADYNLLFLATGGGRLNFAGTEQWLAELKTPLFKSIDYALCLDSLGGQNLYLHFSKPPKEEKTSFFYDTFTKTGSKLDTSVTLTQKQVNLSDPNVYWEHEQFSKKRKNTATLSTLAEALPSNKRCNLFDQMQHFDYSQFKKNLKFTAEALASLVFNVDLQQQNIFDGALEIDDNFVKSWLQVFSNTSRVEGHFETGDSFLVGVERTLREYTTEVHALAFPLEGITSYDKASTIITVHQVKSPLFEVFLGLIVVIYLIAMYFFLNQMALAQLLQAIGFSKHTNK